MGSSPAKQYESYDRTLDQFKKFLKSSKQPDRCKSKDFENLRQSLNQRNLQTGTEEAYIFSFVYILGGESKAAEKLVDDFKINSIQDIDEALENNHLEGSEILTQYNQDDFDHGDPEIIPETIENLSDLKYHQTVESFEEWFEKARKYNETYYEREQDKSNPPANRPADIGVKTLKDVIPSGGRGGNSPRLHAVDFIEAAVRVHGHNWLVPDRDEPPVIKPLYVDTEAPKKLLGEFYDDKKWVNHVEGDNKHDNEVRRGLIELEEYVRDELGWSNEQIMFDLETRLCQFHKNTN